MNIENECPHCFEKYGTAGPTGHYCPGLVNPMLLYHSELKFCTNCNTYYTVQNGHTCVSPLTPVESAKVYMAGDSIEEKLDEIIMLLRHILDKIN